MATIVNDGEVLYSDPSDEAMADFLVMFAEMVDAIKAKEKARRQKQSAKAKKRSARKAARKGKWPLDKKEALLARFAERSKGKSTDTAKELNSIARAKELAYVPRIRAQYDASKRYGTKPPRGLSLDIPMLGHLRVEQNPALKVWEAKERERVMWSNANADSE